jgi:hypothetical protein
MGVMLISVVIVYTDKSAYRSQVYGLLLLFVLASVIHYLILGWAVCPC